MPIVAISFTQRSQVRWIGSVSSSEALTGVFVTQFYQGDVWFAVVGAVVGVSGAWVGMRSSATRAATAGLLLWMMVPISVLALSGLLFPEGLYLPRYLSFTTPVVALLAGRLVCVRGFGRLAWGLVPIFAIFAADELVSRNDPMEKSSWDHALATVVLRADAGDGWIAYSPITHPIAYAYPQAFEGMININATAPATRMTSVFPTLGRALPEAAVTEGTDRVWVLVGEGDRDQGKADIALLESQGFRQVWVDPAPVGRDGLIIYEYVRNESPDRVTDS